MNTFAFSQQKNVLDYFKVFQKMEEKKIINEGIKKVKFQVVAEDTTDKVIEVYMRDADQDDAAPYIKSYRMTIFEAKNKKKIIVVFGMNCWTGCISNINELYFFDENMQNITEKKLPRQKIINYFKKQVEPNVKIEDAFLALISGNKSKITLYLSPYQLAMSNEPPSNASAFLVFIPKKCRFVFSEK